MKYKIAVSPFYTKGKLLPGDPRWGAFNASFHNRKLSPNDLMSILYAGSAITTHHKNKWRKTENFLLGQHIGLDFDGGDKNSTIKHLASDKFIQKYASCIHTTLSHTEEHPRSRVVFLLDEPVYQAKNYALGASALLWLFGTADRQCKDAVRFFYGAEGCKFEFIDQVLPLSVLKKIIVNYQETGMTERRKTSNYLPPASQADVSNALKHIDPWKIDYDEWVSVLMAIHSQFGEGGYMLAESWAGGKKGEVQQKWKSFKQSGNVTGRVGAGTLFSIAQRFGYYGLQKGI